VIFYVLIIDSKEYSLLLAINWMRILHDSKYNKIVILNAVKQHYLCCLQHIGSPRRGNLDPSALPQDDTRMVCASRRTVP
jgi:hypothetical protein